MNYGHTYVLKNVCHFTNQYYTNTKYIIAQERNVFKIPYNLDPALGSDYSQNQNLIIFLKTINLFYFI